MSVEKNLQLIQSNIQQAALRAKRDVNDIQLITVSKTRSVAEVKQAIEAGCFLFGENTIQDAKTKIPVIDNQAIEWHFIGHLQSKKAKDIPGNFNWIHTVDSIRLAEKLSNAMLNKTPDKTLNCLIQVNVSKEASKSGISLTELSSFLEEWQKRKLPCLTLRGLMTIGVKGSNDKTRESFLTLSNLLTQCNKKFNLDQFDQLSMGMSEDYQIAVEEGATMLRLGTSIFGKRQ